MKSLILFALLVIVAAAPVEAQAQCGAGGCGVGRAKAVRSVNVRSFRLGSRLRRACRC